jgi:hypothetical protein
MVHREGHSDVCCSLLIPKLHFAPNDRYYQINKHQDGVYVLHIDDKDYPNSDNVFYSAQSLIENIADPYDREYSFWKSVQEAFIESMPKSKPPETILIDVGNFYKSQFKRVIKI